MKLKETENRIESRSDRIKISDSTATQRELDGCLSESTKINFFIQNPHQNEPVHAKTFNYEARTNMANNKREKVRSVNKPAISIVTRTCSPILTHLFGCRENQSNQARKFSSIVQNRSLFVTSSAQMNFRVGFSIENEAQKLIFH